jgi:ABC-type sugar transport system substrate-binding protein
MKRSLLSTVVAAVAVVALASSTAGADAPPLKIGLVSTLSGNFAQSATTAEMRRIPQSASRKS